MDAQRYDGESRLFRNLDDSQRAFVDAPEGDLRLIAPAGCGKTMCILHRCLALARMAGANKPRFLVVTFTVAARDELLGRLNTEPAFRSIRDFVEISTLNSWGYRRIRSTTYNPRLLKSKEDFHFAVLNQLGPIWRKFKAVEAAILKNKTSIPRQILEISDQFKSLGFDHERDRTFTQFTQKLKALEEEGLSRVLANLISNLARLGILPTIVHNREERASEDTKALYKEFYRFWIEATKTLISNETFTLEDQKYFAYLVEQRKLEEGSYLSGAVKYDHVIVDEFQDINPLDLKLIRSIADRHRAKLTIVGDDDQAIFEWRGANPIYILEPERFFGRKFQRFILERNYRSPKEIIVLSQKLIAHNRRRVEKEIKVSEDKSAQIDLFKVQHLYDSMQLVISIIEKETAETSKSGKVAIIGRKKSQLIPYQIYFASRKIKFCAAEDLQVFLSGAFERLLEFLEIHSGAAEVGKVRSPVMMLLTLVDLVKRYPLRKQEKELLKKYLNGLRLENFLQAVSALRDYRGLLKGENKGGGMSRVMAEAIEEFLDARTLSEALGVLSREFEGLQMDFRKADDDIFYADPPFEHLGEFA